MPARLRRGQPFVSRRRGKFVNTYSRFCNCEWKFWRKSDNL